MLYVDLARRLAPLDGVGRSEQELHPPIDLLRLFYGGRLAALTLSHAGDAMASEAFGGGLTGLRELSLLRPRLSAYGIGHVGCALGSTLVDLSVRGHTSLDPSAVALLCSLCPELRRLRLIECGLALDAHGAAPLLTLRNLTDLDLGGNPLAPSGVLALCSDRSEGQLRCLSFWGSSADDACALGAMRMPALTSLDASWTRLSYEGASCITIGLSERLRELRLAHCNSLRPGECAAAVLPPIVAVGHLTTLSVGGLSLDEADVLAICAIASLTALDMSACRLATQLAVQAFSALRHAALSIAFGALADTHGRKKLTCALCVHPPRPRARVCTAR